MNNALSLPQNKTFHFLPLTFRITVWSKLKPYFVDLLKRNINSKEALQNWLTDRSELNAAIEEEVNQRYILLSKDVNNEQAASTYNYLVQEVMPAIALMDQKLDKRLLGSPFCEHLAADQYFIHLRAIRNRVHLYREENLDLLAQIKVKTQTYGRVFGQTLIHYQGEEQTIGYMRKLLENPQRSIRKEAYLTICEQLSKKSETMESLFDELLQLRQQVAENAGFANYRDFRFRELERFDYSPDDCKRFHLAVQTEVLPFCSDVNQERKRKLRLEQLRPWDLQMNMGSPRRMSPFDNEEDLLEKAKACLAKIHPSFANYIQRLQNKGHLDLMARKGKRPGGFTVPLPRTKTPYLFMSASCSKKDIRTFFHESGHSIHFFLMHSLQLDSARKPTLEVAEMAAMALELLSMDYWGTFYDDPTDLRFAKINQLEKILHTLPWVATVDRFQHWLYENPQHTRAERSQYWTSLMQQYQSPVVEWTGIEQYIDKVWHRQSHIFKFPFYYIEYAFAQLGAIAIWKNYRENPTKTIQQYCQALRLGNTRTLKETFQVAGIRFDFSRAYLRELVSFVKKELDQLRNA
ncbi:MAG: M3 family oligoendopeptidase [Bacteroidota bacterium]